MVGLRLLGAAALCSLLMACGQQSPTLEKKGEHAGATTLSAPAQPPADDRFPLPYPHLTAPPFAIGQDVEVLNGGKWVAVKVVEVTTVNGEQVVRTSWPGGASGLPYLMMDKNNSIRLPTGRLGADLSIGRYTCYDGGTDRSDLNFRVAECGHYTDPYGDDPGTFEIHEQTIRFVGGKLDGLTGQQLANSQFYFTPRFTCRRQMEG